MISRCDDQSLPDGQQFDIDRHPPPPPLEWAIWLKIFVWSIGGLTLFIAYCVVADLRNGLLQSASRVGRSEIYCSRIPVIQTRTTYRLELNQLASRTGVLTGPIILKSSDISDPCGPVVWSEMKTGMHVHEAFTTAPHSPH
jgi:hypothetical protein